MASNLQTSIYAYLIAHLKGAPSIGVSQHDSPSVSPINLDNGTGQNQANALYEGTRTLAASANETLDLYGGLTDPFGGTINFTSIKAIEIFAHADNVNDVVVGNAATFPFLGPLGGTTPTITLKPGSRICLANPVSGWAVANGSTDNLKVANSGAGTSITYDLKIVGIQ